MPEDPHKISKQRSYGGKIRNGRRPPHCNVSYDHTEKLNIDILDFFFSLFVSPDLFESDEAATLPISLPTRVRHAARLQASAVCAGGGSVKSDRPGRRQC